MWCILFASACWGLRGWGAPDILPTPYNLKGPSEDNNLSECTEDYTTSVYNVITERIEKRYFMLTNRAVRYARVADWVYPLDL